MVVLIVFFAVIVLLILLGVCCCKNKQNKFCFGHDEDKNKKVPIGVAISPEKIENNTTGNNFIDGVDATNIENDEEQAVTEGVSEMKSE